MIEKIFSNKIAFYILVFMIWTGMLVVLNQWLNIEREQQQLKQNVLQNLENLDSAVVNQQQFLQTIDKNDHLHITMEDVKRVCKDMEKVNPGWKCPKINDIKTHGQDPVYNGK